MRATTLRREAYMRDVVAFARIAGAWGVRTDDLARAMKLSRSCIRQYIVDQRYLFEWVKEGRARRVRLKPRFRKAPDVG